jgi:hypothetical protein
VNDNEIGLEFDDFLGKKSCSIEVACSPAIIQLKVVALYPTKLLEALFQGLYARPCFGVTFGDSHEDANFHLPIGLLRADRKRPYRSRTTEKRDERASPHLITYSSWHATGDMRE